MRQVIHTNPKEEPSENYIPYADTKMTHFLFTFYYVFIISGENNFSDLF